MIRIPPTADPTVAVVVVTYGGREWPLRTLEALVAHTEPRYEVVVVDNASPDGTGEIVEAGVEGARVVRNDRNVGLAAAQNQAAAMTSAPAILLLNPDALVQEGWLPPLLERLDDDRVAAAVPRLLEPDGTVQEAGQLVDRVGQTLPVGGGADASLPRFRYPRVVEYGTGACLLVRREDFAAVGGLDEAYTPAYCEDIDLGLRLQQRGRRVIYEPRSTVVHHGGVSTDEGDRVEMILRNRRTLLRSWGPLLADRPMLVDVGEYPHRPTAIRDLGLGERLLVVADEVPGGGVADLLVRVASPMDVLVTAAIVAGTNEDAAPLAGRGVEVVIGPDERWFEERLFHYSGVLVAGGDERLRAMALDTQPQATLLSLPGLLEQPDAVVAPGPEGAAGTRVVRPGREEGVLDLRALLGGAGRR